MSTKQKIFLSLTISILIMVVVGLTMAIVLVASTVTQTSSMSVRYEATNVSCTLEASAKLYANDDDTTGEIIKLSDDSDSFSIDIKPEDSVNDAGNIAFKDITLTSTGRAIYQFKVTNTASLGAKSINFSFKFVNQEGIDNISVKMGAGIESVSEIEAGQTRTITIEPNNKVGYIYLVYSVEKAGEDAELTTSWNMNITQAA